MAKIRPAEMTEELNDVWRLVVGYTKQETTAPLRGIGRFVGYGIGGMTFFALSTAFGALAVVRGFQTESGLFNAYLSFVPYLAAFVVSLAIGYLAYRSVKRTPWKKVEGDGK